MQTTVTKCCSGYVSPCADCGVRPNRGGGRCGDWRGDAGPHEHEDMRLLQEALCIAA